MIMVTSWPFRQLDLVISFPEQELEVGGLCSRASAATCHLLLAVAVAVMLPFASRTSEARDKTHLLFLLSMDFHRPVLGRGNWVRKSQLQSPACKRCGAGSSD